MVLFSLISHQNGFRSAHFGDSFSQEKPLRALPRHSNHRNDKLKFENPNRKEVIL